MRKLRLGLDLDGVIYNWSNTARFLLGEYRNEFPGESQNYDWIKDHISKESWDWLWGPGVKEHGLFRYGNLYKGAREFLLQIEPMFDCVVITSRPPSAVLDTMDWLAYQQLPVGEVHIVGHGADKSTVLPHCEIYLDDAIHNAEDIMVKTNALMVMPDKPWNQGYSPDDFTRFYRGYSWAHIKYIFETFYQRVNREEGKWGTIDNENSTVS